MNFTPPSAGSVAAFLVIVAAVLIACVAAVHRANRDAEKPRNRRTLAFCAALVAWLGALAVIVERGLLEALPLRGLPFFFGAIFVVSAYAGLSAIGRRVARTIPLAALVGFQAFRLPLELVLHRWAEQGVIPTTMTWTGQNWDIISGAVALVAAPFANRRRGIAWTANLIGAALLLNVIRVAVLSSPLPFGWDVQPKLLLALHLPYALIGPVCVGGALAGHLVLTRALLPGADSKR